MTVRRRECRRGFLVVCSRNSTMHLGWTFFSFGITTASRPRSSSLRVHFHRTCKFTRWRSSRTSSSPLRRIGDTSAVIDPLDERIKNVQKKRPAVSRAEARPRPRLHTARDRGGGQELTHLAGEAGTESSCPSASGPETRATRSRPTHPSRRRTACECLYGCDGCEGFSRPASTATPSNISPAPALRNALLAGVNQELPSLCIDHSCQLKRIEAARLLRRSIWWEFHPGCLEFAEHCREELDGLCCQEDCD